MRIDTEVLAILRSRIELTERNESQRRVDAGIGREARVRRVDPPRVRGRVPVVDRAVVLDARIGALPSGLSDLAHELARVDRVADRLAVHARGELPVVAALDGVHELVGDANRVVRVLVLDRGEAVAVDAHVEAGVAQRGGLLLLARLAP